MGNLKVLFLYPNMFMMSMVPPAIAIFSALLKDRGHRVDLFDTTYHRTDNEFDSDKKKEESLQVRPFDRGERKIEAKATDVYEDFAKKVESFGPDLIAMSCVEDMWPLGLALLKSLDKRYAKKSYKTLLGGVFPTFAPHIVMREDVVDMACVGEGEIAITELCEAMAKGKDYSTVTNLWVRKEGDIVKNPVKKTIDLNDSPIPDFTLFDEQRLYRPMAGKIYRMLPVETHRGCPYTCSFCNSPSQQVFHREAGAGSYFRKKGLSLVRRELEFLIDKWKIEYVYFPADTFLAWNQKEFDEFIELYSDFKLPFWVQTRPETMSDEKMKKLSQVGIHRMSIGLEHGNEKFRREVIKRNVSNEVIIRAFGYAENYGIPVTVNNIVGFPDETRELAQDTVEINTKIKVDTTNCYAFAPFHGTPLRELAVKRGYMKEEDIAGTLTGDPLLNMPRFPRNEISGLMRVMPMYAKFPRERWPEIRKAEKLTPKGDEVHKRLREEYIKKFFRGESEG